MKISKLPSWRGLQKNHAQLHNYPLGEASRKIMLNFDFTKDFPVKKILQNLKKAITEGNFESVTKMDPIGMCFRRFPPEN